MQYRIPVLILLTLAVSCSRYPGYRRLTSEIRYRLIQFGDSDLKLKPGDYATLDLEYRTAKDSVFFSGLRKVRISAPADASSVDNCFLKMKKGDSASFILPAEKFFTGTLKRDLPVFIAKNEVMKINARMTDVQTEEQFREEKQMFLAWSAELSEYENVVLRNFLLGEDPDFRPGPEGFYLLSLKNGNGRKVKTGDHIWVNYEGKFLNGRYFDGTYRTREPVDFIYGTQYVLIEGLEKALSYMTEGEKVMVILPSGLAFGETGDDSGIIPPYTSLVYTLEVLRIE